MVTPGLWLEFLGGVTADLKLVSVDHECPILEALITGNCRNADGGTIPGNGKLKTWKRQSFGENKSLTVGSAGERFFLRLVLYFWREKTQ